LINWEGSWAVEAAIPELSPAVDWSTGRLDMPELAGDEAWAAGTGSISPSSTVRSSVDREDNLDGKLPACGDPGRGWVRASESWMTGTVERAGEGTGDAVGVLLARGTGKAVDSRGEEDMGEEFSWETSSRKSSIALRRARAGSWIGLRDWFSSLSSPSDAMRPTPAAGMP
jgi:hypothetical protein